MDRRNKTRSENGQERLREPIGPQPALLQAVLEKMQQEAKEAQEEDKAKGLEEQIQKTKEFTAETALQVILILRMTRCYSKPMKPKNYKVKMLMKQTNSGIQSTQNTFFVSHGGVKKIGVAPKGATTRQVSTLLTALESAVEEDKETRYDRIRLTSVVRQK